MLGPPPVALHRRIHADVEVHDPVQRCGDHIDGRGRGEAAAPQARGIEVVYAIPTVARFLICSEGPHCRFGVGHHPVHS